MIDNATPYRIAVPTVLMRTLALPPPHGTDARRAPAVAEDFDLIVDVFAFSSQDELNLAVVKLKSDAAARGTTLVSVACSTDGTACDALVAAAGSIEECLLGDDPSHEKVSAIRPIIDAEKRHAEFLSRCTGMRVVCCYDRDAITQPPFPDEPETIRLFSWGRPPGIYARGSGSSIEIKNLFGLPVWQDKGTRLIATPTRGRGRIVDGGGMPIFQVIGRNYYQLFLTTDDQHDAANRERIFRKSLGILYRDLAEEPKGEPAATATTDAMAAFAEESVARILRTLRKKKQDCDSAADLLTKELTKMLRESEDFAVRIKTLTDSGFTQELRERIPRELEAIRAMDRVADVRIVDDGVHVETTTFTLAHGDVRRTLGPFVIRLDTDHHTVEIWSETPRHPKGHHHPHVDRKTLACFGNVSVTIAKAMVQYRFADAARIALQLLGNYSHKTTIIPLEEWPADITDHTPKEEENHAGSAAQPVTAEQAV